MTKFPYYYLTSYYCCEFKPLIDNKKIPYGTVDFKWLNNSNYKNMESFEDNRLPAISIQPKGVGSVSETALIYNYSITYSAIMFRSEMLKIYINHGLIPLCFYPTSHAYFIDYVDDVLNEMGLNHYRLQAEYNHTKTGVYRTMFDSWISRIDAANFVGCKPEDLTMTQIYKSVMNYELT